MASLRAFSACFWFSCSLLVAAACVDAPGPSAGDGTPPGSGGGGGTGQDAPFRITVFTFDRPALIAFRDRPDGPWRAPTALSDGLYTFDARGPYVVTIVCDDALSIRTQQIARALDDDRMLGMACLNRSSTRAAERISVTGRMRQPGAVWLGRDSDSGWQAGSSGWAFELDTTPEPHDLIAISSARIAIRRDQIFTADVEVPELDLDQEGVALAPAAFTVSNAAGADAVAARVTLSTRTTTGALVYEGPLEGAKVAPAAILRPAADQHFVRVSAERGASHRFVERHHPVGAPTGFVLPDPLDAQLSTSSGEVVATWSTLPAHDTLVLEAVGPAGGTTAYHELELSRRFVAATRATQATLETDIPGYQPRWRIAVGQATRIELEARHVRPGERRGSSIRN